MRLTRSHLFLLGGLCIMIMSTLAFTQPGPPDIKGGRGGKGKGKGSDFMFAMLAGGKETFTVSAVEIPQMMQRFEPAEKTKENMMTFLQKKGVTDGVMTKALYSEYSEERMTEMRAKWAQKNKDGAIPGGIPSPAPAVPGAPTPAQPSADPDAQARDAFKRLDTNNDGALSVEEMQAAGRFGSRIYDERDKWDRNRNGKIELDEYIEYTRNRNQQRKGGGQPPPAQPDAIVPQAEDKRPVVYRVGKLPKDLPTWFEELDQDKDGQVGLYEWKAGGKSVDAFLALDHNGDGFITAEEVLRDQKTKTKVASSSTTTSTPSAPSASPPRRGISSRSSSSDSGQEDSPRGRGPRGKGGRGKGNRGN